MRSGLRRVAYLVSRYRADGRLPPPVRRLYADVLRARTRRLAHTLGRAPSRRHVVTAGAVPSSVHELSLDAANAVVDALESGGLRPFVVARNAGRIVLGLPESDRTRGVELLSGALRSDGWHIAWEDRRRTGVATAAAAVRSRSARRARALTCYRAYAVGERTIGPEAGVVLTFWALGSSGQMELVGTRGHERFDPRSPATVEVIDGHEFPGRAAFPVGRSLERFDEPVDVVYTWVDGADPAWLEAFERTAAECGRSLDEQALDPARFRTRDELRFSLRSVWMYCGWVRHIYVVTAGQRPSWLGDHPKITVVDHSEIIPAEALPTFNSHAIEASLHHIEGLAEHLIYFNDDMMVARPLQPEVFFHPNGLPKVFQGGARVQGYEDDDTAAVDTAARRGRELLDDRFGRVVESKPMHSPYPLLRSVMAEVESTFPDIVGATRRSRFRSPSDLSTAASFSQHYAYATGRAVLGEIANEYANIESSRLGLHLDRIRLTGRFDTFCLNETGVIAPGQEERDRLVADFFERMYPVPAPWEVGEADAG